MSEVIREGAVRVGVDLAKRVIQVHAVDAGERVLTSRALARDKFLAWCARLLLEFGLAFAVGPRALQAVLSEVLEDASNTLGHLARLTLQRAQAQWRELDEHLAWCDERIADHGRTNVAVQQAATLIGVGPISASAAVATVGDFKQFKSGAQFAAWIGLVPRQHSSGGKDRLGGITKVSVRRPHLLSR